MPGSAADPSQGSSTGQRDGNSSNSFNSFNNILKALRALISVIAFIVLIAFNFARAYVYLYYI